MNLVVDGVIYQLQARGGISRIFSRILPRMCAMDETLRVTMLTSGQLKQALPVHPRLSHRPMPRIARLLRRHRLWGPAAGLASDVADRLWMGLGKGRIWHSTYYTLPDRWRGALVVTVFDLVHERLPRLFHRPNDEQFRQQKRKSVLASDAVICISNTTAEDVMQFYGVGADKIRVVPLAHDGVFKPLAPAERLRMPAIPRQYVLYVGFRDYHKNFDSLLQAFASWRHRREVGLVVVGKHWSNDEKKRVAELRLLDRVHIVTDADDEALCQLYNRAAALVYPSLHEGFGIPLLEAMACGCPVVASRIPSTTEVAGGCPIYFAPASVDDLVLALDRALSEGRGSPRVRDGIERAASFSWDATARQTLEVYRAL